MRRCACLFWFPWAALVAQSNTSPPAVPVPLPSNQYSVAAWGDSFTAGGEDGTGVNYPAVLASITGFSVFNGGIGGQTSTKIASRMLASPAMHPLCQILWAGRNNYAATFTVLSDTASMVRVSPPNCFLVLAILNGEYPNELKGQTGWAQIKDLNAALAAAYPDHYLDIRTLLIDSFDPANALDVWDHNNNVPPSSLRATSPGTATEISDTSTCAFSYTLTGGGGYGNYADTLLVDSEYIWIGGFKGTASGPYAVTRCKRGYAGSIPAKHMNNAVILDVTPAHLNAAGYTLVAQKVAGVLPKH